MKRLLALLFLASGTASASFCGSYTYQRTITVSSSNVTASVLNFPVPVMTSDVTLSTNAAGGHLANSNGYDVIFSTDPSCNFVMNWDTETVNNTGTNKFIAWVKVPVISTASATGATFYMTYGNSGITSYQGSSAGTWDSNFFMVLHLSTGASLSTKNSTNVNAPTNTNGTTQGTGQIDGAGVFNGSNQSISYTGLSSTSTFSYSTWAKITGSIQGGMIGSGADNGIPEFRTNTDNTLNFDDQGIAVVGQSIGTVTPGVFSFLAVDYNLGAWHIYINGSLDNSGTTVVAFSNGPPNQIGANVASGFYSGTLDEFRMSNSVRNADWIKTEYNVEGNNASFVTIGAEQGGTVVVPPASSVSISGGKMSVNGAHLIIQ